MTLFQKLLASGDVPVEVVRTLLRTQALANDSAALVADIEERLKKSKKDVAAEIGKQLLAHQRAVFAREWKLSSLLASVLPRRDWNSLFLDKLALEFEAFVNLPGNCRVLKIEGGGNERQVVERLDHIQSTLSACPYNFDVVPTVPTPRKRNAATAQIVDPRAKQLAHM